MKSEYLKEYADRVENLKEDLIEKVVGKEYERTFFKNTLENRFTNFIENLEEILDLYVSGRIDLSQNCDLKDTFDKLLQICDSKSLSELQQIQREQDGEDLTRFQNSMVGFKGMIQNDLFYKQSHTGAITDFSKTSIDELQKKEGISIENNNGVNVYTLNGIPFYMFIHKGDYDGIAGTHGQDKLSVSMISDKIKLNTIGSYRPRRLLVFNTINASDIIEMRTQDLFYDSKRRDDVQREQKMMIDEFLCNVTEERGKDYTDYSIHTLYTSDGEIRKEGKLQPDAIFVIGDVLPEDVEYAKSRGIDNVYSYREEIYQEKTSIDEKAFQELLQEYTENLNPNILVELKSKTAMKSELFVETIREILLSRMQKEGINKRLINVNARTLVNMFIYEEKTNPELSLQIEETEKLDQKAGIELESGSDEERKFIEIRQREIEKQKMDRKKGIINRLKEGVKIKDKTIIYGALKELLDSSENIEDDFLAVINFAKNNTAIIRQTGAFASIAQLSMEIMNNQKWCEEGNFYFENYLMFTKQYRDVQTQTNSLENIDYYFGLDKEENFPITNSQEVSGLHLGKDVLQQIKDTQGRRMIREELNKQVHILEYRDENNKQEIGD